jgi:hypothetical protein
VIYVPRTMPGFVIEPLLDEQLVLVSSVPRSMSPDWQADYVFVHRGDDFRAAHSQAYTIGWRRRSRSGRVRSACATSLTKAAPATS